MKKTFLLILIAVVCMAVGAKKPIKVACVGNSITYGTGIKDRAHDSYPAQLQLLLGKDYEVGNFGKPGATLLYKGHRPYVLQQEFKAAMAFKADIVVIHLGINDTDPRNWPNHRDEFIGDYRALMDSFKVANPHCRIIMARITPISYRHPRFESGTRDWHDEIQTAIEQVATGAGVQLIDFYKPFHPYPNLQPDTVHPNEEGARVMAKIVYQGITGDYGGLALPMLFTDNMVVQRNKPVDVHGTADAGSKVTVTLGEAKAEAVAGLDGRWSVALQAPPVGKSCVLEVRSGKQRLSFSNVVSGEVWLCSGQSNMEFMLEQSATARRDIPKAACKDIRLFDMKARWRTDAVTWDESVLDSLNYLQYYTDTKWTECSPVTAARFSAIAYYFGRQLYDSLHVPIGLICNAIGGSPAESWVDRYTLEHHFPAILRNWTGNDFIQDWVRGRALLNVKNSKNKQQRHPYEPCYLFEAGIRPLESYPLSGVIWYQGESNAHNKDAHAKLFGLLVDSWRTNWNDAKMPFYFVQLSSLNRPSWPWFRDSQRLLMQKLPATGMVVSSDKGDSLDVHPRHKQEIGQRLAAWALNKTYNRRQVVPSGPLYKSVAFDGNAAIVSFFYAEGLTTSDGKAPATFEIAGADGIFHPAVAVIEGAKVRLMSSEVASPKVVRYAWQPFTRANLVNSSGFPASTFRTDTYIVQ